MVNGPLTECDAWATLSRGAGEALERRLYEYCDHDERYARWHVRVGALLIDYSRQRMDDAIRSGLLTLAEQRELPAAIDALLTGSIVNSTETRPAYHSGLRDPAPLHFADAIQATRERIRTFAQAVRSGAWRGYTGKTINQIVHVGIGGSNLGPELVTTALGHPSALPVRYLANIDGHAMQATLHGLDPERTLFLIASKTFGTVETRENAAGLRSWFLERVNDVGAISKHFVAVSANESACAAFGIPQANLFPLWDWVGGRFSVWSSIGLPIALSLGAEAFEEFLAGAHELDQHFQTQPLNANAPVLLALVDLWNNNFLGTTSHAVLCYDQRLALLPTFLQQLLMESNGKRVASDGSAVNMHTQPIVWGGVGTQGQHSYHQLLHQGTRAFCTDFVGVARPDHKQQTHSHWLHSHFLGQLDALVEGEKTDDPHRLVPGDHPANAIVLEALTPRSLGQLLALYEHRTYCLAVLWGINAFDQWGVALGKRLADRYFQAFSDNTALASGLYTELRRQLQQSPDR